LKIVGAPSLIWAQRRALVRALRRELTRARDRDRLLVFSRRWLYDHQLIIMHARALRSIIVGAIRQHEATLARRIHQEVDGDLRAATLRRNILRACVAARFTNELMLSRSQVDQTREQLRSAQEWLLECREEITHDDPVVAVRVGFYSTLQSLQTALLFENLPEDLPISTLVSLRNCTPVNRLFDSHLGMCQGGLDAAATTDHRLYASTTTASCIT
jgi:hypothetical protein